MSKLKTKDGTQIYYKNWSIGQPVVFSHGWPLCSDKEQLNADFLEFIKA